MDPITRMAYDIQQIKRRLDNILQTGIVTAIHAEAGLVDVDIGESIEEKIPFFTRRAGEDKTYWMPSVGEKGLMLSPSGDLSNAMFLPALNTDLNPPPRDHEKWTTREWADGTTETYDKDAHVYELKLNGDTHRKVNREELQDKRGNTEMNMDGTEAELKNARGNFKVNAGEAKIVFGATEIILNASGITLVYGASRIVLNAAGITFTGPRVENTAPVLSWNSTPTTPIAWIAIS